MPRTMTSRSLIVIVGRSPMIAIPHDLVKVARRMADVPQKILVTGAAGFIGFHCAQKLAADGHTIAAVDNMNSYYLPALKQARAAALRAGGIEWAPLDICDRSGLRDLAACFRPD